MFSFAIQGCLMSSSGAPPIVGPDIYATALGGGSGAAPGSPATLAQAMTAARAYGTGAVVHLRDTDGDFAISAPLTFDAADDGITYQAYAGESPRISGGVAVTGWTVYSGSVYRADLPAGLSAPYPQELYVGGRRAKRARGAFQPAGWTKGSGAFTAPDSAIAGYAYPGNGTIVGRSGWKVFRVGVASASGTTVTIRASDWAASQQLVGTVPTLDTVEWVEGYRELVTEPGDFAVDADGVYYYPRPGENMATVAVVMPIVESLVSVDDTPGTACALTFSGIEFAHCTFLEPYKTVAQDAAADGFSTLQGAIYGTAPFKKIPGAITIGGVVGVTFDRCRIERVAQVGIAFEAGAQSCSVTGCVFSTGASAYTIGSPLDASADPHPGAASLELSGITIADCVAIDCAWQYESADALGVNYYGHDCTIERNVCVHARWAAISEGFGWGLSDTGGTGWPTTVAAWGTDSVHAGNTVANNALIAAMALLSEGATVYANGAQGLGSFSENYIEDAGFYGFYLDNGCEGAAVSGNAIFGSAQSVVNCQTAPIIASSNTIGNTYVNSRSGGSSALVTGDVSNVESGTVAGTEWTAAGYAAVSGAWLSGPYSDLLARNVARIETATALASSYETSGNHFPARVIDGFGQTYWQSAASDTSAWVAVDIGIAHDVTDIVLEPRRGSATAAHRSEFIVEVAASWDGPWTTVHTQGGEMVWPGDVVHIEIAESCRYVRITKTDTGVLAVSSLRVFGSPSDVALLWGVDWSDLPTGDLGAYTPSSVSDVLSGAGGGLVFGTTSAAQIAQTGAATAASIAAGKPGIAEYTQGRGLSFFPATANVTAYRDMSAPGTPGSGVTYTAGAAPSPLGGADTSHRVQVNSGGYSNYSSAGAGAGTRTLQFWIKSHASANVCHVNRYDGTTDSYTSTPGTSWQFVRDIWTSGAAPILMMSDGRAGDGGIPAAGARDHDIDLAMVVDGKDYGPWCSTTRSANSTYSPGAQWFTSSGRLKLEIDMVIGVASADLAAAMRLWTDRDDATTYVEVDTSRNVNVSVGGSVVTLPSTIPAWSALDDWRLRVDAGNGAPTGSVTINAATTSLGTGVGSHASIAPIEIDIGCNGTSNLIPGIRRAVRAYV